MVIIEPPYEPWPSRLALAPPTPVRAVSAAGGLVVAAGDALHVLRPGERDLHSADLPPDLGVVTVAAEPWPPFRVAISSRARVSVFDGAGFGERVLDLQLKGPEFDATHLAWVRHDEDVMLYLRQRAGEVARLRMEGVSEILTVPHTSAIAADANGVLSLVTLLPSDDAAVWILPVGAKEWDVRQMVCIPVGDDTADWVVYLAVHGTAVAFSMDDVSADVSWREHEDDTRHFESPPAVFHGPIAFQGENAIFAAYNVEGQVRVLRHERGGSVTCIGHFGLDENWEGTPATVTGIAWDDERRILWAASPELGLIEMTEPGAPPRTNDVWN